MAYAFANAPRYTFLLPDDTRPHAKLPWYWEATIRASIHSGGVVQVAHDAPGSAVLGVTIWGPPEQSKHSVLTLLRSGLVGDARPARRPGLATPQGSWPPDRLAGATQPMLAPEQHRRRPLDAALGSGEAPLSTTCSRASMTMPCPRSWIRPQPDNLGYYERFGFRVTAETGVAERHTAMGHDKAA